MLGFIQRKSEIKEALILVVFVLLLSEPLTGATIGVVILGSGLTILNLHPGKIFRNIITLFLFAIYWFTYGKIIDPEVGLNFLTSIVILKLLEKETIRDRYMVFFGIILLISAGSLFNKSLIYVFYFALSFFVLIQDLYENLNLPSSFKNFLSSLLWVLPFTVVFFFLAPRMMSPFEIMRGGTKSGEIGYTTDVNLSTIKEIRSNDRPVFQASFSEPIGKRDLYWRGNVISFSDGWNWTLMPSERAFGEFSPRDFSQRGLLKQNIRVFGQQDFFFGLDTPGLFITPKGFHEVDSTYSLAQSQWAHHYRYEVYSLENGKSLGDGEKRNLKSGLKLSERKWIADHFKSSQLSDLAREIQNYFTQNGFSYSLSPGTVSSFLDFMQVKKIGFCSHYASAVALIFREKKIPTRLVSGFLGGTYNRFADFFMITQNDAHVWIEAYQDSKWIRVDPTDWILPERIRMGGEAFMQQQTAVKGFSPLRFIKSRFTWFNEIEQWVLQWDFKFYQWIDQMDYYGQLALLAKFSFKREWLFTLLPILCALFMGVYALLFGAMTVQKNQVEKLWFLFSKKMQSRGLMISYFSIEQTRERLKALDPIVQDVFQDLVRLSFSNPQKSELLKLKKRIKNI